MAVVSYGSALTPYVVDTCPVDGAAGTLAGIAERDSWLLDAPMGWTYRNMGTKAAPSWVRWRQPDENVSRVHFRDDFLGGEEWITLDVPLMDDTANANQIPTTGTARGYVTVPRSGVVTYAEIVALTALDTDDTNYVTFTSLNKRALGAGSSAVLAANSAYNTTDSGTEGAVALVAKKVNPLECNVLAVNRGDVIEVTATVTGELGGAIACPVVKLHIQTLARIWTPRVSRIAGSPTVISNSTLAGLTTVTNGNAYLSLSGTNEAQYVGMDWGLRNVFAPSAKAIFEARVWIGTNPATNSRICIGIATALQNAASQAIWLEQQLSRYTYDPTALTNFAWFKFNASMALLYEVQAGGSSSLANATGLTLSTSTWYTLTIDCRDLAAIRFLLNGQVVGTVSMAGLTGAVVPNIFIQKDSGTNAPTLRVDYVDATWNRS
jgi:hypothetical protein